MFQYQNAYLALNTLIFIISIFILTTNHKILIKSVFYVESVLFMMNTDFLILVFKLDDHLYYLSTIIILILSVLEALSILVYIYLYRNSPD